MAPPAVSGTRAGVWSCSFTVLVSSRRFTARHGIAANVAAQGLVLAKNGQRDRSIGLGLDRSRSCLGEGSCVVTAGRGSLLPTRALSVGRVVDFVSSVMRDPLT